MRVRLRVMLRVMMRVRLTVRVMLRLRVILRVVLMASCEGPPGLQEVLVQVLYAADSWHGEHQVW